jgi:predicted glycosyltransferase
MRIWFDLDNAPHVPLFRPVISELGRRGAETFVTARDFNRTLELCRFWNLPHTPVGAHGGKGRVGKVLNLFRRAAQLAAAVRRAGGADLAVSHGSRTQVVAARFMGIPSVVMMDYEYTEKFLFTRLGKRLLLPAAIPDDRLASCGFPMRKVERYDGFKEELYLPDFRPAPGFRASIGVPDDRILLTIRPSAMAANYHDPRSEKIVLALLEHALRRNDVHPLVVSRTRDDRELVRARFGDRVPFLEKAVDGLQLIWHSDVFVSGGGTMNREAALLGVPVFSIFTGRRPYLDEHLASMGRLTFIETPEQVASIPLAKRTIPADCRAVPNRLVAHVCDRLAGGGC